MRNLQYAKVLQKDSFPNRLKRNVRTHWELYLFCIPGLILIVIFNYIPMYSGILMSFMNYIPRRGLSGSEWIGIENFRIFFSSFYFKQYLWNTLRVSIYSLVAGFPLPIILAIMINEIISPRFKKTFQTISYAPYFISMVVIVSMLKLFFSEVGIVNSIITLLGGESVYFEAKAGTFPHMYVWSGIWQSTGYSSVLYLATLSSVDPQLIDAARIDGANKVQRIWNIDIPAILPTATIMLIFAVGSLLSVGFEKVLLMQTPINIEYSEIISTYVYKVGILMSKMSFSAAVGLSNSIANFILLVTVNFIVKRMSETSLW
ncbi:MAG: ABC transporter permease subunit [Clostridia bacterium]|nr:ABC transporter permease subunit [Clostridia bacterium]